MTASRSNHSASDLFKDLLKPRPHKYQPFQELVHGVLHVIVNTPLNRSIIRDEDEREKLKMELLHRAEKSLTIYRFFERKPPRILQLLGEEQVGDAQIINTNQMGVFYLPQTPPPMEPFFAKYMTYTNPIKTIRDMAVDLLGSKEYLNSNQTVTVMQVINTIEHNTNNKARLYLKCWAAKHSNQFYHDHYRPVLAMSCGEHAVQYWMYRGDRMYVVNSNGDTLAGTGRDKLLVIARMAWFIMSSYLNNVTNDIMAKLKDNLTLVDDEPRRWRETIAGFSYITFEPWTIRIDSTLSDMDMQLDASRASLQLHNQD